MWINSFYLVLGGMQTRYKLDSPWPEVLRNQIRTRCSRWRRRTAGREEEEVERQAALRTKNSLLSNSQAVPAGRDLQASKMSLLRALMKVKEVTVWREFPLYMYKK